MPVAFDTRSPMAASNRSLIPQTSSVTIAAATPADSSNNTLPSRSSATSIAGRGGCSGPAIVKPTGGVITVCPYPARRSSRSVVKKMVPGLEERRQSAEIVVGASGERGETRSVGTAYGVGGGQTGDDAARPGSPTGAAMLAFRSRSAREVGRVFTS